LSKDPATLKADFQNAQNRIERIEALKQLLKINNTEAHIVYYSLLVDSPESQVDCFEETFKNYGTCEALKNMGSYLSQIAGPHLAEYKRTGKKPKGIDEILINFEIKIDPLMDEMANVAESNINCLFQSIKKQFLSQGQSSFEKAIYSASSLAILVEIGERGFAGLLKEVKTEDDETVVYLLVEKFGPHAVIPAIKQYENPTSSKKEQNFAGVVLMSLPDYKEVYDKIVEAYRHGRYYPSSGNVTSFDDLLGAASSWWGTIIESAYKDKPQFVHYVASEHLAKLEGQDAIIKLLAGTNISIATIYFKGLNLDTLSRESMTSLVHSTRPIKGLDEEEEILGKIPLFEYLFAELDKKIRENHKMLFSIGDFPHDWQEKFIKKNFSKMTKEEKSTAIYMAKKLPKDIQKRIFGHIRPHLDGELLRKVDPSGKEKLS